MWAKATRLQRALIQFFLDQAGEAGYVEVQPPYVVNEASGYGTGQLPDKEGQMYYVGEDNLYLIPTAEVPVTNLYRDVILSDSDLPVKKLRIFSLFSPRGRQLWQGRARPEPSAPVRQG